MNSRITPMAILFALLCTGIPPAFAADATLSLNANVRYQTIEGFGTFWEGVKSDDGFANFLANDLGESMVRFQLAADYCTGKGSYDQGKISDDIAMMKRMKAQGVTRWITSVWSPPAWMKDNNDISNGGSLKPENYQDFADMVVKYCKTIKQETGTELYAFSIQNELEFVEWYVSCVYTPTQYRDVIRVLGPAMKAAGLTTKLFGPEAMTAGGVDFTGPSMRDSVAGQYWKAFAFHSYNEGVNPVSGSAAAGQWKRLKLGLSTYKRPLWMTETSGIPDSWDGAMDLAGNIYAALRWGDLAAWVWWHDCGGGGSSGDLESLLDASGCGHSQRSLVSKNFYKWIRPDARRMDCKFGGDSIGLFGVSFYHAANKTITIVMLNQGSSSRTVSISGAGCPANLELFRTTSGENCADIGSVSSSNVTLTAGSVNTLYATNYDAPVGVTQEPARGSRNAATIVALRTYGIDGRLTARLPAARVSRVVVQGNAEGRLQSAIVTHER